MDFRFPLASALLLCYDWLDHKIYNKPRPMHGYSALSLLAFIKNEIALRAEDRIPDPLA